MSADVGWRLQWIHIFCSSW